MAPVLAITGMVARTSMLEPFDRVGEISKPFVTGPNRIPISAEENRDDDRQNAVAEPEREKGTGAAAARELQRITGVDLTRIRRHRRDGRPDAGK